jgi:hypothetical protein
MISDNLIRRVLGTPNEESWPGVKQLPDYKPTFPQWSAQSLAEQVPYLDAAGTDLLKVRYLFLNNLFFPSPYLYHFLAECLFRSKHFHMTALVASPQNAPLCTHISPITVDRCSAPCVAPPLCCPLFRFCHAFLSPFVHRSSYLCHL